MSHMSVSVATRHINQCQTCHTFQVVPTLRKDVYFVSVRLFFPGCFGFSQIPKLIYSLPANLLKSAFCYEHWVKMLMKWSRRTDWLRHWRREERKSKLLSAKTRFVCPWCLNVCIRPPISTSSQVLHFENLLIRQTLHSINCHIAGFWVGTRNAVKIGG